MYIGDQHLPPTTLETVPVNNKYFLQFYEKTISESKFSIYFSDSTRSNYDTRANKYKEPGTIDIVLTESQPIQQVSSNENVEIVNNITHNVNGQNAKRWRDLVRK